MINKNCHLVISALILIPIALAYGTSPDNFFGLGPDLSNVFDFKIETIDLKNILMAIMGLYFAMITLWITGIFNRNYWLTATITNVLFMYGLGLGRLISILYDGMPSLHFFLGMFAEFLFASWGVYNLKKYKSV
ncbi:MAG TPA: DUF4345 domain-containing protein [Flavobacterium sp.]|jgi:hypothetical protein